HQIAVRSFHLWGAQLPVCARCTGLYVGAASAAIMCASTRREAADAARTVVWTTLGIAVLPTLASLLFEWTTGVMTSNLTRAAAGRPLGAPLGWVIYRVN